MLGQPVQLGGATGARPGAAGEPPVFRDQQAVVDQAIEVERGQRARYAERGGGLVATDGSGPRGHVLVEASTDRLGEGGQLLECPIGRVHGLILLWVGVSEIRGVREVPYRSGP